MGHLTICNETSDPCIKLQGIFPLTHTQANTKTHLSKIPPECYQQTEGQYLMASTRILNSETPDGDLMKMVIIISLMMIISVKTAESYNNVRLETRSVRAGENFHSFSVEDWR